MKKIILLIVIIATGFLFYSKQNDPILVTNFEECIEAGNPAMESYPRQCRDGEDTFTEGIDGVAIDETSDEVILCEEEQRNIDACIEIYQPVCATVNIQCITEPCNPVKETYSNSCFACNNPLVSDYIKGKCFED